jgi:hypothetical protein
MTAGEKPEAALRALLTGEFETYKRLLRSLDAAEGREFMGLVSAAFLKSADRQFGSAELPSAVVEWVGKIRSESPVGAQAFDPVVSEQVILVALGLSEGAELTGKQLRDGQLLLLPVLVDDQQLDSAEIEELLAAARDLAQG